ncbi:isohexenylglutaconyl-CoA hydratase [Chitinivorax tropicus]|uniref:Isohexenylglutaconyl-CoA hydratase n=1 Tax=Chitinivorax tropicus TaxID=714531 RepID=A0A840MK35_9PROT|nr:enoyl-CoA hydratase/isomerase family protein [Chitinivorax tropicus]MBB5016926.1 isohexenylglutaconyl-CoA hydratase [Chitinivorax tropicus]
MVFETLQLARQGGLVQVTLNRPAQRNAMSLQMVAELSRLWSCLASDAEARVVVLQGAGGHFCAGGDVRDMAGLRHQLASDSQAAVRFNRQFGQMLQQAAALPQVLVAVLQGAVLGGGLGLACVADIVLAHADCQLGMPETGLGLIPAQIAPFVAQRIGLSQARWLALSGQRIDGRRALSLGLVQQIQPSDTALTGALAELLAQLARTAPLVTRQTKRLMQAMPGMALDALLDEAASCFSEAMQGAEAAEGAAAFIDKRVPSWVETWP